MQNKTASLILLLAVSCGDGNPGESTVVTADSTSSTGDDTSTSSTGSSGQTTTQEPETSPTTGTLPACGNGVLESGEACDDGSQNDDSSECKSDCSKNVCGDGLLLLNTEMCDDGNTDAGDGCDAGCKSEAALCPPDTTNRLLNPDFEGGTLPPWKSEGVISATMENAHSGVWSARVDGNEYLQQDLAEPTPVANVVKADFWSWHDSSDAPLLLVEWVYDDLVVENQFIEMPLDGWQPHEFLGELDASKSLLGFRVWGYFSDDPGANVALFDDFALCAAP